MSFQFRLTPYCTEGSRPQIRQALEKHSELASRAAYPGIWKLGDRLNRKNAGKPQRSRRGLHLFLRVLCLILGLILLPVGLSDPSGEALALFVSIFAIVYGLLALIHTKRSSRSSFDRSADKLIGSLPVIDESQELTVIFSGSGMTVCHQDSETESVPYSGFRWVIETADFYLCIYDSRYTLLQKKDLSGNSAAEFSAFLAQHIQLFSL